MATRKTSKTAAIAPVEDPLTVAQDTPDGNDIMTAAAAVVSTDDAMTVLKRDDITAPAARLCLSNSCGRTSPAAVEMSELKAEFATAPARSAVKTALRLQIAQLKAEMDQVRIIARQIIDTAALEYQERATVNASKTVEEQRDAKRARFLKLRDWLRANDPDWLDNV